MKSIFELASNLTLVLTKLDTELGLAQPQLVNPLYPGLFKPRAREYI